MRPTSIIALILILFCSFTRGDTAFFYGSQVPVTELSIYDNIVVLPEHINTYQERRLFDIKARPIAYLSLGEVASNAQYADQIPKSLFQQYNEQWQSHVIDISQPAWHQYLLNKHIPKLMKQGYEGLFFDTLDSYTLLSQDTEALKHYRKSLESLILSIRQQYPDIYIIANRGFELMPVIAKHINEVVAESLFSAYEAGKNSYQSTSASDQQWLINQLQQVKNQYGLPITVIDYLPASSFRQADQLARRIDKLGFTPWITNGHLTLLGQSTLKPVPRQLIGLFYDPDNGIYPSALHQKLASSAEYLGYYIEYINLATDTLPDYPLRNRIAGIVSWFDRTNLPASQSVCRWINKAYTNSDIRVAVFEHLPEHPQCLSHLSVSSMDIDPATLKITQQNKHIGNELPLRLKPRPAKLLISQSPNNQSWLTLTDKTLQSFTPVLIGDWGGVAQKGYALIKGFGNKDYWLVDPLEFLTQSLQLKAIPAPDTTTENGLQIATAHIDGDGFVSRNPLRNQQIAGQIILDKIIKQYPLPTTVSIIEAEISPDGVYPKDSKQAMATAREIFQQPNVEIASHSFSHPYFWEIFDNPNANKDKGYGQTLPVPGYSTPSLKREINGSVNFINTQLAPNDKQVKVFLWSGDAIATDDAVELTQQLGLQNVNGANLKIFQHDFSMSRVWPVGLPLKTGYQIYAPVMNENVYTNLWNGPYFGYRNVINTFEALSKPKRLKPLSIYYHFYSGEKNEGLLALHDVYQYVLSQPINAMYLSDYAKRANAFYTLAIGQEDDIWHFAETGALRTLRVNQTAGFPELSDSKKIIGFADNNDQRYIHLSDSFGQLKFSNKNNNRLYLQSFSGQINNWITNDSSTQISIDNYTHGKIKVRKNSEACKVVYNGKSIKIPPNQASITLSVGIVENSQLELHCG